ncbi:MAG: hypothetical protein H7326_10080 [Bdellovibrionaceae bacterium]|nr:hypothetical protein [Pseudobdellovibrionaceae bacterium]
MLLEKSARTFKDYDVLGVGAVRRAELLASVEPKILQLHPGLVPNSRKLMYDEVLEQTIGWLKPAQVIREKFLGTAQDFVFHLLLQDFSISFPKLSALLPVSAESFLRDYLSEFPWQGPLLTDQLRYVPLFVKQQFQDSGLNLLAQKEWLWSYLHFADFGSVRTEPGRVTLNASLQTLHANVDAPTAGITRGLYIFYYDERSGKVLEHKMQVVDALVVDKLQDDRKYTLDQLIEQVLMMEIRDALSADELRKRVFFLIEQSILQVSDSKIL